MGSFRPIQTPASPNAPHSPDGGRKSAGDAIFSVVERIISQLSQFAIFLLAARMLGPAEFGIFALASACAILLLSVAEVAWVPFIISREGDETVPLQILFVAIINGILFGCAGAAAALAAGAMGLSHDVMVLSMLFALWVALANASRAQKGILIWMDRLKSGAICEIGGELVGLAVAIYALHRGHGVFALVYGRLACQTVILTLSFAATRRWPRPGLPGPIFRELWSFSVHILASRILSQARTQLITLIIGGFLGAAAVGFYRAAERLVGAMCELITVPAQLLAWTHLRRARDQGNPAERQDRIARQAARHLKLVIALGAPPFLWLMLMNKPLVTSLLGPEWAPAGSLVAILALGRMLLLGGNLVEPLMTMLGAVRSLPPFMARIFALSMLLTLASAPFGVVVIAWGQTLICAVILIATFRLFERKAGLHWWPFVSPLRPLALPLACGVSGIMLLDMALSNQGLPPLLHAFAAGLGGAAFYLAALAIFDHAIFAQVTVLLKSSRHRTEVSS